MSLAHSKDVLAIACWHCGQRRPIPTANHETRGLLWECSDCGRYWHEGPRLSLVDSDKPKSAVRED